MKDILYPLRRLHGRLHDWYIKTFPIFSERLHLLIQRLCHPRAVYLVLTPEHGNLGDHAIAKAETDMLRSLGIDYIEVTGKRLLSWFKNGLLDVMNGRTILVNGGGNLGTLWFHNEQMMRELIRVNHWSHIFILPNTIFYPEDDYGKQELIESQKFFNAHKHLKLYAREKTSFGIMKKAYSDVSLVPDMVLMLNESRNPVQRCGCLLCLRNDRERTRSEQEDNTISCITKCMFNSQVSWFDMVKERMIPVSDRDKELEKQFDAFRHAELVITDRLHGMIFCAITGTPCIVINSKSPKVKGCYEWIKDLPYIRFCDDVSLIPEIYKSIPKQDWKYDNSKLRPLFDELESDILKVSKGKRKCPRSV